MRTIIDFISRHQEKLDYELKMIKLEMIDRVMRIKKI